MSDPAILTVNGGSSSVKFALFTGERRELSGVIERIGSPDAVLTASDAVKKPIANEKPNVSDHAAAAEHLIGWLGPRDLAAVGHRVVHGGIKLVDHQIITPSVLEELKRTQPLDLAHLPREIALIEAFAKHLPEVPQYACFDTAFHRDLPRVAQLLPIPRKYLNSGLRRFGFHGLSYTYLMEELRRLTGDRAHGRVILAHLGSGASLAAVHQGKPVDTTMAFTPTAGVMMATRPGDIDPGLLVYLARFEKMSPDQLDDFINKECGLKGVSGGKSDMRDLLAARAMDFQAADAVELFCYTIRKSIAALSATLGGLDTLVFAGGIGEHVSPIREEICRNLEYLGVRLNNESNAKNGAVISEDSSSVVVRVIPTDEEIVMARIVRRLLQR